jgi:hypothetical protein
MMRRRIVAIALLGALAALLAGCGAKGLLKPDLPPSVSIFVQGPVDTVNHNVHLFWFGTDPDGYVTGYDIRLLNPSAPADTEWTFTTRTDSVFSIYTPTGFAAPTFEVRAIDNADLKSAIARQDFKFSNLPPTVRLQNRFRQTDTTFASATLQWTASDPDGDGTKLRFRIWLDGNEANGSLVPGSSFTIPSAQFLQDGQLRDTLRTVYIQAVDDGGMLSAVDSARWFVRAPGTGGDRARGHFGRLLIIDDVPRAYPNNFTADTIYYNTAARNLLPGQYSILQMDFTQPFRSAKDMEQTFGLFDAVVWYIGGVSDFRTYETTLANYQAGLGAYLESGGKVYLDGMDLINGLHARGPLKEDFVSRYLGSDFLFRYFTTQVQDSTEGWANAGPSIFVSRWGDSLQVQQLSASSSSLGGFRAFGVQDNSYALVWAPPAPLPSLLPAGILPLPVPVAVSVPQPSGGRMMLVTFPVMYASPVPSSPPQYRTVHRFMAQVFKELGLAP